MSDDKPTPLQDVRKGLGLLFRAARTAVEKLPKGGVEEVVVTSAREVGRALENVASAIEREVFGKRGEPPQQPTQRSGEKPPNDSADESKSGGQPKPPDTP
jgi:hypothetical protein